MRRNLRACAPILLAVLAGLILLTPKVAAQSPASAGELRITGNVSTPLTLTVSDLKRMPRKTLSVVNSHENKKEMYEGVLLEDVLRKAGVPQGENMRGPAMATYVVAEAEDSYRVVFSLAELDSGIVDSEVIVADTMDGAPLAAKQGLNKLSRVSRFVEERPKTQEAAHWARPRVL